MGLAASQARLLTITARLADNELRSQTINNAKMRLATQSSQASDDYVMALNNARLMFSNVDAFGNPQTQVLNFNNLTAYSPYNTQYGLTNSAGLALVSETEAALYKEANGNLETYLEKHGLKWSTTFFESDIVGNLQQKLTDFYAGDYAYLFGSEDNDTLKQLYEDYQMNDISIEKANYEGMAQDYYYQLSRLYNEVIPDIRYAVLGDNTQDDVATRIAALGNAGSVRNALMNGASTLGLQKGLEALHSDNTITEEAYKYLKYVISTLRDATTIGGQAGAGFTTDYPQALGGGTSYSYSYTDGSGNDHVQTGLTYSLGNGIIVTNITSDENVTTGRTTTMNRWDISGASSGNLYYRSTPCPTTINGVDIKTIIQNLRLQQDYDGSGDGGGSGSTRTVEYFFIYDEDYLGVPAYVMAPLSTDKTNTYMALVEEILEALLNNQSSINLSNFAGGIGDDFVTTYGFRPNDITSLLDFDALMERQDFGSAYPGNARFTNIVDAYKVELMIDVLGEPNYTWIDENDTSNTGNPEAKAQWYTNLFNRMQKGFKILEDGLASSSEWLEYAFESGLVSMEQVDKTFYWNPISYNTCSSITEESDGAEAVAKAEAKYKRAMNDIESKDKMYDMQLKNIDTEHTALQTEYDVIKTVINKNIERTMKFNQSA